MNKILCYLLPVLFFIACNEKNKPQSEVKESGVAIVIHGGAGTILKKNMTKETVYNDAENGCVCVYIGAGNKVGWAKTSKTLKYILDTKNINVFEDRLFFSSSMDFADEYGFATHDGAKEIFYTAQRMIQDEIVANGQFACDFDG